MGLDHQLEGTPVAVAWLASGAPVDNSWLAAGAPDRLLLYYTGRTFFAPKHASGMRAADAGEGCEQADAG